MVPLFFQRLTQTQNEISTKLGPEFVQLYLNWFDENPDENLLSWLSAFASGFKVEDYVSIAEHIKFVTWTRSLLERVLKWNEPDPELTRVALEIWTSMVYVYKELQNVPRYMEDKSLFAKFKVFEFMKGCNINDVRVVIIGEDPCVDIDFSGYAFHNVNCPSTRQLIDYHNEEMAMLGETWHKLEEQVKNGINLGNMMAATIQQGGESSLQGWIDQNVLLLNVMLTADSDQCGWELFTGFIVKYLSKHRSNLVFFLVGEEASRFAGHIDKTKHLVQELHPISSPHDHLQAPSQMSWKRALPFINTNFYLYKRFGGDVNKLIDWHSRHGFAKKDSKEYEERMVEFFGTICNVRKIKTDRFILSVENDTLQVKWL